MADKLGISQSAMAQIESRDSTPQLKTLERVAKALARKIHKAALTKLKALEIQSCSIFDVYENKRTSLVGFSLALFPP